MRAFAIFRKNRRWLRQVDAHADGRLTPIEEDLLEERLGESPAVRDALATTEDLKRALGELPAVEVPRSFAIDASMLAGAAPVVMPRSVHWTLRLSQGTAMAALAAFATLAVLDLSDPSGAETPQSAGTTEFKSLPARAPDANASVESGGTAGAGVASGFADMAPGGAVTAPSPVTETFDTAAREAPSSDRRSFKPLYFTLAGVLALAVASWIASGVQSRRYRRGRLVD